MHSQKCAPKSLIEAIDHDPSSQLATPARLANDTAIAASKTFRYLMMIGKDSRK